QTFRGGVHVATADVNGDGQDDVITAPGNGGGPLVRVWDGNTGAMLKQFMAYDANFRGGAWVAGGDMNGDGKAEIVTGAGQGGGPDGDGVDEVLVGSGAVASSHVRVLNATDGRTNNNYPNGFQAFPDTPNMSGVRVKAVDLNGDKIAEIVTAAGPGTRSVVRT